MSAEGRVIAGRYRLHQKIGSGAMGVVWRAVDERLHRTVAVKQLLLQAGYTEDETEEARQRAMREGRIAARLQHQHAIVVFDVAEDEGHPVLVMEYLPSRSLASVLEDSGPLPPLEVARIGSQVAGALAAAHMAGIVHRDLKPGNILLGDDGIAKITDFGISRAIGDVSVTKSGILAGTPAYLSPEVALGRDPAPASDVFSLGSTLYAAIEGVPPFGVDENAISLLHRVARGDVDPPRNAGPMTAALMQLLRPDPVERPTMAQAKTLLQAVVEGRPVPSSTPPGWRPAAAAAPARQPQEPNPTRVSMPAAQAEQAAPRRRGRAAAVWIVALVLAVLVGVLVANAFRPTGAEQANSQGQVTQAPQQPAPPPQPSSAPPPTTTTAPTTTTTQPTTTSSTPTSAKLSEKDMETAVKKYFNLVPDDLDEAWAMLGPGLRAQGKDRFTSFWESIDDVKITSGPKASGNKVAVTLRYEKDDKKINEQHVIGMVEKNGKALLNSDSRG